MINADHEAVYLGRMDDQFKILGHRVYPAAIEAALCALPEIGDCVVSMVNDAGGHTRLAAHVVLDTRSSSLDLSSVRKRLAEQLPRYMQPSILLPVTRIPQTSNGKRDQSALVIPPSAFARDTMKKPGTQTEQRILSLVGKVAPDLSVQGVRNNLSDAGLDSIDLVNLLHAIEADFNISLDTALFPGSETVEFLSLAVDMQLTTPPTVSGPDTLKSGLAKLVLPHMTSWPGDLATDRGFIRHLPKNTGTVSLYWMFQGGHELAALDGALALEDIKVFGSRSGHLAFEYAESNLSAFAALIADEIESLPNDGPIHLGGNCQGGMIMLRVAKELMRRGRTVGALILMEQGRFPIHHGPVALLFGDGSYLNPYALLDNPDIIFQAAYPLGYDVEIISGQHGGYFKPQNIESLASAITKHIFAHQYAQPFHELRNFAQ
ncbi:MAG: thioesterase domain-containing protein [Lysobacterales bacterium]